MINWVIGRWGRAIWARLFDAQVLYFQRLALMLEYTFDMEEGAGKPEHRRDVTCILWHEIAASLRPELLAALRRPHFSVTACNDAYAATGRVLAAHAAIVAGESRAGLVVLVLVDPAELESAPEVIETIQRHAPSVVIWMFESQAGSGPQLRTVRQTDLVPGGVLGPRETAPGEGARGSGEVSGGRAEDERGSGGVRGEGERLLTDEELSMLLDIEPKETPREDNEEDIA